MNKIISAVLYTFFFVGIFLLDRITKVYALHHFVMCQRYSPYLAAELTFNRGISWGMCNFADPRACGGICLLVLALIIFLTVYTFKRFFYGYPIIGETLVLAGALSNTMDRFLYAGVIDFIVVSYGQWVFPVFNVADVCIFFGVVIMCFFTPSDLR